LGQWALAGGFFEFDIGEILIGRKPVPVYDFIGPRKTGKPVCKYLTLSFIPPEFAGFQFFTLDVFEYDFVRRDDEVIIRQPLCILRRQRSVWFLIFVERDQDSLRKNILDGNRVF